MDCNDQDKCGEVIKGLWKCTLVTFKGQILSPQTRGYVAKLNVQDQEKVLLLHAINTQSTPHRSYV